MEELDWKESVGKRFLTRVTETSPHMDNVVVYMREIEIKNAVNDGEQVKISFPDIKHDLEWADTMTNTLRIGLLNGGVETHEVISEIKTEQEEQDNV